MDEKKIKTIAADISALLVGTEQTDLRLQGSKDLYAWVERTLNRL